MKHHTLRSKFNAAFFALVLGAASTSMVAFADDESESNKAKESEQSKESESGDKESGKKESGKTGGTYSSYQSSVRPFGLSIVDKVKEGGSDEDSKKFQSEVLPHVTKLLNEKLGESKKLDDSGLLLDPSKLKLKTDSDVRVYFVGEGAGYANTLGFTTDGSGSAESKTAKLIFPNASSTVSSYDPKSEVKRTEKEPLLPGDFADLGKHKGGTALDFFLIANGANGGKNAYSTQKSVNPDGINHVISFAYAMKDSPYLVLGFEDLFGGGDRDFNDLLFVVDIGSINVADLTATPEPATFASMGAFLGLSWALLRRRQAPVRQ